MLRKLIKVQYSAAVNFCIIMYELCYFVSEYSRKLNLVIHNAEIDDFQPVQYV